ncbi:MAG: tail protein X [Candidatus Fimivivens sp.]|nr:tail protein X [Candidatus Fimivivens sp.]
MTASDFLYYKTRAGDTFDIIALDYYNSEFKAMHIAAANPVYAGTVVFDAGVLLKIPVIEQSAAESLPPWKRG